MNTFNFKAYFGVKTKINLKCNTAGFTSMLEFVITVNTEIKPADLLHYKFALVLIILT